MATLFKNISIKKAPRAFTVIEVLLVVILFSVAVAAIFPNFKQFYAEAVLDNSVQRVVKLFEYARARAVMENTFLRLSLDTDEDVYVLEKQNEDKKARDEYGELSGKFGRRFQLPDTIGFGARTSPEIFFNPDGSVGKYRIEIEAEDLKRILIQGKDYFGTPQITEEVV